MISIDHITPLSLFSLFYTTIEFVGILTAVIAVHETRTPQGAIAWAISLITFPFLSLPLYWIFGRAKFNGYVGAMRAGLKEFNSLLFDGHDIPKIKEMCVRKQPQSPRSLFEELAQLPFLGGNNLKLLVDGAETFDTICNEIEKANKYVIIQFYIFRDDSVGRKIRDLLIRKAEQSISVFFLYDEIGCHNIPFDFFESMRESGILVYPFQTTKGRGNRFQINFRNHRKIVVVDGHTAFVGGHNVGNEYLGYTNRFSAWRDTHLKITGPAVLGVQISFAKDWYWATGELVDLDLTRQVRAGESEVLALSTGPADKLESCLIMFIRAIGAAQGRFWVASPYFVPDDAVIKALLRVSPFLDRRYVSPRRFSGSAMPGNCPAWLNPKIDVLPESWPKQNVSFPAKSTIRK